MYKISDFMYRYISGGSNDSSRTSPCVCKESWPRGGLSGGLGHCAGLPCGNQQLLSEAQLAATRIEQSLGLFSSFGIQACRRS